MEWTDVPISDPESPTDELIKASAGELQDQIRARPGLADQAREVIARRLTGTPDAATWETLRRLLVDCLGRQATGLLMWMSIYDARDEDGARRLQRLRDNADDDVFEFVLGIRTSYANEFKDAWDVYGEMPHNWRVVDREVYVDVASGRPYLRLLITKYNGEQLLIEGTSDSFLKLAGYLALTLSTLSEAAAFTPDAIDYYVEKADALATVIRPTEPTRGGTDSSAA